MNISLEVKTQTQAKLLVALLNGWFDVDAKPGVASNSVQSEPLPPFLKGDLAVGTVSEANDIPQDDVASGASVKEKKPRKAKDVPVVPEVLNADEELVDFVTAPKSQAAEKLTLDEIRTALQAYTQRHDLSAGIAKLSSFGVKRISELQESQYVEFVEACKE
jgi:hypothetical protein